MVCAAGKLGEVNVLASRTDWAWPLALEAIFRPCGVNLLVACTAGEFLDIAAEQRVHAMIVDADHGAGGLATVRLLRSDFPRLPCLMVSSRAEQDLLERALRLDVFSVIGKPVDMTVLRDQLHRVFVKVYQSDLFQHAVTDPRGS